MPLSVTKRRAFVSAVPGLEVINRNMNLSLLKAENKSCGNKKNLGNFFFDLRNKQDEFLCLDLTFEVKTSFKEVLMVVA